jgi:hypothetical protein
MDDATRDVLDKDIGKDELLRCHVENQNSPFMHYFVQADEVELKELAKKLGMSVEVRAIESIAVFLAMYSLDGLRERVRLASLSPTMDRGA